MFPEIAKDSKELACSAQSDGRADRGEKGGEVAAEGGDNGDDDGGDQSDHDAVFDCGGTALLHGDDGTEGLDWQTVHEMSPFQYFARRGFRDALR